MSDNLPPKVTQAMIDRAFDGPDDDCHDDPIRQALVDHLGDGEDAHDTADAIDSVIQRIRPHLGELFALAQEGGAATVQAVHDHMANLETEVAEAITKEG